MLVGAAHDLGVPVGNVRIVGQADLGAGIPSDAPAGPARTATRFSRSPPAEAMAGRCEQCDEPTERAQVRIMPVEGVWIERVAAVVCRSCGFLRLTKSGREKLARGIVATDDAPGPRPPPTAMPLEIVKVYGS